ncbi:MAG: outer membrane beta-barrel protein [Thermoanaerobaculia bacterium]
MKRLVPAAFLAATSLLAARDAAAVIPEKGSVAVFAAVGPTFPFEGEYDIGFHFEAGGEYYFSPNFALRATAAYARSGSSAPGGSDVTIGGLEASAVYTARRGSWAPFVLGGIGIHSVDPPGEGPSQRLGAHFGAGTEYFLDRRTSLTGELAGRFIGSAGGRTSSFATLTFGIKYHF